jgi:hypothetical protein
MLKKYRARMPYKRFSPAAYTFLVTDFDSVFRRIDFFNTHILYRSLPHYLGGQAREFNAWMIANQSIRESV